MNALTFGDVSQLSPTDDGRLALVVSAVPTVRQGGVLASTSSVTMPASYAVTSGGQISPSAGIQTTGNTFPFVVQGNIGFAWDGSVLTAYWDGTNGSAQFVVRRSDGSQITIPRGSMRISGLTGGLPYGFAPYVSVAQPQTVSFVVGNAGAPRYALSPSATANQLSLAAQQQKATVNESLTSGLIYFTTGAAGASSKGGGASGNPSPYSNQPSTGNQNQT